MNTAFEPKLNFPVGAAAPDNYIWLSGLVPSDSFVVSRHRDGSTASTYGEYCWNLSAYHPEGKAVNVTFAYWSIGEITPVREQLAREARWLLFALMWLRKGAPLSLGTLRNYYVLIKVMARFSEDTNRSLFGLLGDEKQLWQFVDARCSGWMSQTLGSLLPLYVAMDRNCLGIDIVGGKLIQALQSRGRTYRTTLKQHAPMPTRIYSNFLLTLMRELADWQEVERNLLEVALSCGTDARLGRTTAYQMRIADARDLPKEVFSTFKQLIDEKSRSYLNAKGCDLSVKGLSGQIVEVQMASKLMIQAFTGMRDDEAVSLPYHCLETQVANGRTHYIVLGRTTKLNGGRIKRTRWVINFEGYQAIQLAQRIADVVYSAFKVDAKKATGRTNDHPLFVSTGYLNLASKPMAPERGRFQSHCAGFAAMEGLRARLEPEIEERDLKELEHIDPHRAWRSEDKFQVGRPWLFTSHQLRRSLALYAQRSGLVSLPSLRRQLQHITDEMSRYYAKGSSFAKDFIGDDKEHFGLEWQETHSESSALSYVLNVLLSDDVLFGGHANWVEHRLKGFDGSVMIDRAVTLRRFKKGELAYRETLIGGCTNLGECDQPALNWMSVGCLQDNCRNMVCNLSKLERVIAAQVRMVDALDPNSVEYRTEKNDLAVLVSAREKALQQRNGKVF